MSCPEMKESTRLCHRGGSYLYSPQPFVTTLRAQDSQLVKHRTAIALIATLIFLATAPSLFAQGMSALIVCVTDTTNSPLPGTTVVASANGTRYTELADGRGCYEFGSLPPNSYRVTARLPSFDNATKEKITVAPGQTVRVNLQLWISPLCDCLQPPSTLAGLRDAADAVVHLRITDHETQLPAPLHFFMQTARVLEIMKSHPAGDPSGQDRKSVV